MQVKSIVDKVNERAAYADVQIHASREATITLVSWAGCNPCCRRHPSSCTQPRACTHRSSITITVTRRRSPSPSHAFWVDTLAVVCHSLRYPSDPQCLATLMKIAHLPHAAVQHLLLYSTTTFERLLNRSSDVPPATRRAAVNTVVSLVLRRRPVTAAAPDHDGVRLEQLNDEAHVKTLHRSVERLLFALLETCFDDDETIAIPCLYELTTYAHTCLSLSSHAPANAAKKATGRVVWTVLDGSLPRLSV